jgi:hypothetical protein
VTRSAERFDDCTLDGPPGRVERPRSRAFHAACSHAIADFSSGEKLSTCVTRVDAPPVCIE